MGADVAATSRLRREGEMTTFRGFPIKRKSLKVGALRVPEFHVYLGFDTQEAAERWISEALDCNCIKKPNGMKTKEPSKASLKARGA